MTIGQSITLLAAALSVLLAGWGSAAGVSMAGQTSAGVSSENPEINPKMTVLQILPGTQGIYGFLIAVIILVKTGILGGAMVPITLEQGLGFVGAVLPIAFVGLFSAMYQGKAAMAAMLMVGQHPDMSGKAITMVVLVETYAVLALLASFLMVNGIAL
ncbi:MAG TPA: V-type ATP synthase subunit K [Candidatus Limnocylindria bacterium]|nr:V-type ATP synthase subunit K [Candidatus Limnocylindria bacterium]